MGCAICYNRNATNSATSHWPLGTITRHIECGRWPAAVRRITTKMSISAGPTIRSAIPHDGVHSEYIYIYIPRAEEGQPECNSRPPTILSLQTMHTRTARAQFSLPWDLRALAFANTVWHRTAWCVPRTSRRYAVCSWCTPPSLIDCLLHIKFLCKCESFLLWFPQFWLNYIRFISRNQKCNSRGKCMISFTNISCSMCVCVCLCWFVYMFRVQLEQIFSARILSQLHDSQCVTQSKHFVCIR